MSETIPGGDEPPLKDEDSAILACQAMILVHVVNYSNQLMVRLLAAGYSMDRASHMRVLLMRRVRESIRGLQAHTVEVTRQIMDAEDEGVKVRLATQGPDTAEERKRAIEEFERWVNGNG